MGKKISGGEIAEKLKKFRVQSFEFRARLNEFIRAGSKFKVLLQHPEL